MAAACHSPVTVGQERKVLFPQQFFFTYLQFFKYNIQRLCDTRCLINECRPSPSSKSDPFFCNSIFKSPILLENSCLQGCVQVSMGAGAQSLKRAPEKKLYLNICLE